jgi:hypothetical protein
MKIAIIQSNYLPWKGYFDIINDVDCFVFLEDVQYTKNDWRNRNKLKTPNGTEWFTVPVIGGTKQKIYEAKIDSNQNWEKKHKKMINANYSKATYYNSYKDDIMEIYNQKFENISELNIYSIKKICDLLNISTEFINSIEMDTDGVKENKIIDICCQLGANEYLSGPAAKNYIHEKKFRDANIKLFFKNYSDYPEYPQVWGEFSHFVSIIDLLFNCGEESSHYIWGWREKKQH